MNSTAKMNALFSSRATFCTRPVNTLHSHVPRQRRKTTPSAQGVLFTSRNSRATSRGFVCGGRNSSTKMQISWIFHSNNGNAAQNKGQMRKIGGFREKKRYGLVTDYLAVHNQRTMQLHNPSRPHRSTRTCLSQISSNALYTFESMKHANFTAFSNNWRNRIKATSNIRHFSIKLTRVYPSIDVSSSNASQGTSYTTNSKSRKSSTPSSKSSSKQKSPIEPKLQDTEVPIWSFFANDSSQKKQSSSWDKLPHLTKIDLDQFENSTSHQNADGTALQPPPISKVLSILVPESKSLLLALGALTIATTATMQFPSAIGQMIDILSGIPIISGMDGVSSAEAFAGGGEVITTEMPIDILAKETLQLQQMQTIALQMMGYFTVGAVATFGHSAMFDSIGQKIGARLRKQLFTTILHQEVAFFDQNRAGELANRLSTDVHEVAEHLVQNIAVFLSNAVRSLTAIASMAALSPTLTLYLIPIVPLMGGCAKFYGTFIKRWSKQHLDVLAHSTHVATERFSGISTVLSFSQSSKEVARYSSVIEAAYGYARRVAVFQGAFLGSSYFVGNAALLGVLWIGATQVFEGNMTAGQLAGFCMFAGHLAEGVSEISESVGGFLKAQGSGARLFSLLDRDSFSNSGGISRTDNQIVVQTTLKDNQGQPMSDTLPSSYTPTIRFEKVQFSYPSHPDVPILNEVSFSILNGEMLAITGSSGSGKSSVASLLMRLREPTMGKITLDGVDIRELSVEWLRSQIGAVSQEPILFHASVFENVAYGKPNATHDEVIEACIAANAHHFILDLPNGYDTIVGERGASVSGGQKQRLSIARALLTKPRILVLDEASSALDAPAEQDFLNQLRFLLESKDNNLSIVLFITHKKSVLQFCDHVAVLSGGRITEKGTYDDLDKTKGDQLRKLMMGGSSILK